MTDYTADKNFCIFSPRGVLDLSKTGEIDSMLKSSFENCPHPKVILDLEHVRHIDSSALGLILRWYKKISLAGGLLVMCKMNNGIIRVIKNAQIDQFIPIFKTLDPAIEFLNSDSKRTGNTDTGEKSLINDVRNIIMKSLDDKPLLSDLTEKLDSCEKEIDFFGTLLNLYSDSLNRTKELNDNLTKELKKRQNLEKSRKRALKKALDASRIKNLFIANLAHEIKNPLSAIIGFTKVLQASDQMAPTNIQECCSFIRESSLHLQALAEDLSDIAGIEARRPHLSIAPFEISDTINSARFILQEDIMKKRLSIDIQIPDGIGWLISDQTRFKQILFNLISNAVKFSHVGGKITIIASARGDFLDISVKDSGPGIPGNQLKKIFDPFYQLNLPTFGASKGTGLGLAICRNLSSLLGGSINVASSDEKGSTFILSVSGRTVTGASKIPGRRLEREMARTEKIKLKKLRVMVIGNSDIRLSHIMCVLSYAECCVYFASSLDYAHKLMEKESLDLIFIDLEFQRTMKILLHQLPVGKSETAKVVIVSPKNSMINDEYVKSDSNTGILSPPITIFSIIDCLEKSLSREVVSKRYNRHKAITTD